MRDNVTPKDVLLALRTCTGLWQIVIEFSGSGDSGNIDQITLRGALDNEERRQEIADMPLPPELLALYDDARAENTVMEFIQGWTDTYLFQKLVDWDWYNNDGGGGTITIEPYTGVIKVEGYYNETVAHPMSADASIEDDPDFTPLTDHQKQELSCG